MADEAEKCLTCNTSGYVNNEPCPDCYGQGITPICYDYARVYKEFSNVKKDIDKIKHRLKKIMDHFEIED